MIPPSPPRRHSFRLTGRWRLSQREVVTDSGIFRCQTDFAFIVEVEFEYQSSDALGVFYAWRLMKEDDAGQNLVLLPEKRVVL